MRSSWAIFLPVLLLCGISGAQNAPGNLPWGGTDTSEAAAARKKNEDANKLTAPALLGELTRHLYGVGYFGYESTGSEGSRMKEDDVDINLTNRGFFLDPRFWSHTLNLEFEHSGQQFSSSRILGLHLDGTLLSSRSFPLEITVSRTATGLNALSTDTHGSSQQIGLNWSLFQPKWINLGVNAQFGDATQETPFIGTGFQEHDRTISATATRNIGQWALGAAMSDLNMRSTLQDYEYKLDTNSFQAERRFGNRGDFLTSVRHELVTTSSLLSPFHSFDTNLAKSNLNYQLTKKLRTSVSIDYTSDIREALLSSAVLTSTGGATGSVDLNPTLQDSLLSTGTSSALATNGSLSYTFTKRLYGALNVGRTIITPDESVVSTQNATAGVLTGFTTIGGTIGYSRQIGKWDASWHGGLDHYINQVLQGPDYNDNRMTVGAAVKRSIGRWVYMSDLSYLDYTSASQLLPVESEFQWTNRVQTRLNRRLRLDVGADLIHVNSTLPSLFQQNLSKNDLLQSHGTLRSEHWQVTGATGLRNVNSVFLSTNFSDPLSSQLLSQTTPMASSLASADRFMNVFASYSKGHHWTFNGGYSHDSISVSQGLSDTFTNMNFEARYALRRTTIVGGYQHENLQTGPVQRSDSRVYIGIRRPFKIY